MKNDVKEKTEHDLNEIEENLSSLVKKWTEEEAYCPFKSHKDCIKSLWGEF